MTISTTSEGTPVLDDPQVSEHRRFCPNPECRNRVGQAHNGQRGRSEGCCPRCGTRFSFRPPLRPGELVGDGQFRVERAIAHGGLGWVYLAWDCRVKRWVVLKGLIDPDDPDKHQAAVAELAALANANHPNIVAVHNVVRHPHPLTGKPVDYIVMEYLSGKSLKQLCQERPASDPYLPAGQVCEFALEVLAALRHLHEDRGLLYCDLSPDNVIDCKDGAKLIDLGAVRRIDDRDSPVWGKRGFQDPKIATHGPSVATDLHTVARMMAVLSFPFPGFPDEPIPGPDEVTLLAQHPSFCGLLHRATNPDPQRRFASAADMAEQLEGVLREVRALQEGRPFPAASTRFGPELQVVGADPDTFPIGALDTVAPALALPDPQVPGLLAGLSTQGPDETERVLAALPDPSLETRLRMVRARIELRNPLVGGDLDALERQQPGDWRVDWLRGLNFLVDGDAESARKKFSAVFDALPGEAAPKLALALCAQCAGAAELAAHWYGIVWRTDRSYVSAAFGLARARFALDDLAGMATALEAVPETSSYGTTARLCAVLARARGRTNRRQALVADFFAAAEQVHTLDLDERRRWHAVAELLETVLGWERAGRPWPDRVPIPDTLLGRPLSQRGVRDGLEAAYRELARLAPTMAERIALVDKANHRRNRSWT
jgi:serine/threonine-protein kinase PknG